MKRKKLTKKELLFCHWFSVLSNAREAAAKSGYTNPEKSGVKLLLKDEIVRSIEKYKSMNVSRNEITSGLRRLSFGSIADCIKLLQNDEIGFEEIENMDLFNISEIKKPKGGGMEIKFFDRTKAIEKLNEICTERQDEGAVPFYDAIEKGADAIRDYDSNGG